MTIETGARAVVLGSVAAVLLAGCSGAEGTATDDPDAGQVVEQEDASTDDTAQDGPAGDTDEDPPADEDLPLEEEAADGGTLTLTLAGEATDYAVIECVEAGDVFGVTALAPDGSAELSVRTGPGMQDTLADYIEVSRDGVIVLSNLDRGSMSEGGPDLFELDGTTVEGSDIQFLTEEGDIVTGSISGSCG